MSGRNDLAIVAAHLALQHVCVCGHSFEKHTANGDFCFLCAKVNNESATYVEPCTGFVAVTALVTVALRNHAAEPVTQERLEVIDRILDEKAIRATLSLESSPIYEAIGNIAAHHAEALVSIIGPAGEDWIDPLEPLFLGWVLGFGVAHQDPAARAERLSDMLAVVARAAEKSAAVSAQIELRRLQ